MTCTHTRDAANEVPCPPCAGSGRQKLSFKGEHTTTCYDCHGCGTVARMVECPTCSGSRYLPNGDECDCWEGTGKVPAAPAEIELAPGDAFEQKAEGWWIRWEPDAPFTLRSVSTHNEALSAARAAGGK